MHVMVIWIPACHARTLRLEQRGKECSALLGRGHLRYAVAKPERLVEITATSGFLFNSFSAETRKGRIAADGVITNFCVGVYGVLTKECERKCYLFSN